MNTRLLYLILLLFIVSACGGNHDEMEHTEESTHHDHAHHHHDMDVGTPSELSVYNLESHWTDQEKKHVMLPEFTGKIQVMAMVYTHCQSVCPRIVADMQTIDSKLLPEQKAAVNFLLVTIDPERDNPARLKQYAIENSLDNSRWKLLNGSKDDVLELAALLGVKYKKISDVDYAHSNLITVLNKQGEVVYQQQGLGTDPAKTLESINNLLIQQ